MGRLRSEIQTANIPAAACFSRTGSSPSRSSDTNLSGSATPWPAPLTPRPTDTKLLRHHHHHHMAAKGGHNLELQLLTTRSDQPSDNLHSTHLDLSIGISSSSSDQDHHKTLNEKPSSNVGMCNFLREEAREQLRVAMVEKAYAEGARQQAKRQIELAEQEFANAKRIRKQAQLELDKAQALKCHATKQLGATIMQITCHACKHRFQANITGPPMDESFIALSCNVSSSYITER